MKESMATLRAVYLSADCFVSAIDFTTPYMILSMHKGVSLPEGYIEECVILPSNFVYDDA